MPCTPTMVGCQPRDGAKKVIRDMSSDASGQHKNFIILSKLNHVNKLCLYFSRLYIISFLFSSLALPFYLSLMIFFIIPSFFSIFLAGNL